jgi:hypothetical protein
VVCVFDEGEKSDRNARANRREFPRHKAYRR